jgi:peptidoglycan/xylan/chitin deacetylase (PgdA/CDA1 family)
MITGGGPFPRLQMALRPSGVFNGAVPVPQSAVRVAKSALTQARLLTWKPERDDPQGTLRIFVYHRISDDPDPLALSPVKFRAQMEYLAANSFRALDAVTALDLLYAGRLEPRTVAITFDDGFEDVVDNALPVLAEVGFSATVFVATAVIEGSATYSWAPPGASTVSWAQVRRIDPSGVLRFEPHTRTHPDLVRLGDNDANVEISGSKVELEREIGRETRAFCYPSGFVESREREMVRRAGFDYGITCEPGLNSALTDPYLIHRVSIEGTDSLRVFTAKVAGSHDRPLPGRRQYRRIRYGVQT